MLISIVGQFKKVNLVTNKSNGQQFKAVKARLHPGNLAPNLQTMQEDIK